MPFLGPKQPICPEHNFLVQTIVIAFIYLFALFIVQNSYNGSRIMKVYHIWTQSGPFAPNRFFFWGNYYYHSHLPISPFHCAKFKKKSSSGSRNMRMCNLWAQNGPFPPNKNFFRKPVNEPCFVYSCLSTCQKSKSDINLLVKY